MTPARRKEVKDAIDRLEDNCHTGSLESTWSAREALFATIEAVERDALERQQAEIDRLMLEYCPESMTFEQLQNWKARQRPVSKQREAEIEAALRKD